MKHSYRQRNLRSLGILTEKELQKIKDTSVAIAGLGLGGSVFINLVRMGFEKFHIADPDIYERTNINRQRLAKETTIGRRKDECLLEEALSINPDVQVTCFSEGVKSYNVTQFLSNIDWVVDVVDVFALPEKVALHAEARRVGLPVASCATLGFAGSVVIFNKDTPSFTDLTGFKAEHNFINNLENFLQFICPEIPSYMFEQMMEALYNSSHIPFIVPGGEISAAFCAAEITKNIVGFGRRVYAPQGIFADSFQHRVDIFEASHKARYYNLSAKKDAA